MSWTHMTIAQGRELTSSTVQYVFSSTTIDFLEGLCMSSVQCMYITLCFSRLTYVDSTFDSVSTACPLRYIHIVCDVYNVWRAFGMYPVPRGRIFRKHLAGNLGDAGHAGRGESVHLQGDWASDRLWGDLARLILIWEDEHVSLPDI